MELRPLIVVNPPTPLAPCGSFFDSESPPAPTAGKSFDLTARSWSRSRSNESLSDPEVEARVSAGSGTSDGRAASSSDEDHVGFDVAQFSSHDTLPVLRSAEDELEEMRGVLSLMSAEELAVLGSTLERSLEEALDESHVAR